MTDSPILVLVIFAGAVYLARLWYKDFASAADGKPHPRALPGATRAPSRLIWIGVAGALLLVAIETLGENVLGVSDQQSDIKAIALFSLIAAGILEEVIFRGYLVVQTRGRFWLLASIVGFSLIFALLHYQYYFHIEKSGESMILNIEIGAKEGWTLLLLFLNALWFYSLRFMKWNPERSLLPCFAAHIASNIAVFVVKLAQGHVTGLW